MFVFLKCYLSPPFLYLGHSFSGASKLIHPKCILKIPFKYVVSPKLKIRKNRPEFYPHELVYQIFLIKQDGKLKLTEVLTKCCTKASKSFPLRKTNKKKSS